MDEMVFMHESGGRASTDYIDMVAQEELETCKKQIEEDCQRQIQEAERRRPDYSKARRTYETGYASGWHAHRNYKHEQPKPGAIKLCLVCSYEKPWGIFSETTGETVCVDCRDKARTPTNL